MCSVRVMVFGYGLSRWLGEAVELHVLGNDNRFT